MQFSGYIGLTDSMPSRGAVITALMASHYMSYPLYSLVPGPDLPGKIRVRVIFRGESGLGTRLLTVLCWMYDDLVQAMCLGIHQTFRISVCIPQMTTPHGRTYLASLFRRNSQATRYNIIMYSMYC